MTGQGKLWARGVGFTVEFGVEFWSEARITGSNGSERPES